MDNNPQNNPQFDAAYILSLPPQIQSLMAMIDETARLAQAQVLAAQGFIIDVPIQVWGWDPWKIMTYRSNFGFTWVPSALQQNVSVAPGVSQPGAAPYNPLAPPFGSIKVSLNIADYPPFTPVPPAVPKTTDLVGPQSLGNMYLTVVGDHSPDGTPFTDSRGSFVKHVIPTPFGLNSWWELLTAAA